MSLISYAPGVRCAVLVFACLVALPRFADAQPSPVAFVNFHLRATDVEAHKTFWVETLGGTAVKIGPIDGVRFSNGLIELGAGPKPTAGTRGTTVNHVGFTVPNVRAAVDRVKAAGFAVITRDEIAPRYAANVTDGVAFIPDQNSTMALIVGPDDVKVELNEARDQKVPMTMNHIHFASPQVADMQAWYVKLLQAQPDERAGLNNAILPGTLLVFSPAAAPVVGTKGRALDYLGFEVRDLEAVAKRLEGMGFTFDRALTKTTLRGSGEYKFAFLADPWGTYIELTEGLDKIR